MRAALAGEWVQVGELTAVIDHALRHIEGNPMLEEYAHALRDVKAILPRYGKSGILQLWD